MKNINFQLNEFLPTGIYTNFTDNENKTLIINIHDKKYKTMKSINNLIIKHYIEISNILTLDSLKKYVLSESEYKNLCYILNTTDKNFIVNKDLFLQIQDILSTSDSFILDSIKYIYSNQHDYKAVKNLLNNINLYA